MANFQKAARWHVSTKQRIRARSLRVNSTDTERIIWSALRGHRMNGATFRRQTPIGPYIVDFVCHAAKLVIEIDGGQHFESRQEQRDARRDAYLANKGFRVLRFNNHDVMTNREGVLETIAAAVGLAPSLTLQPKSDLSDFGQLIPAELGETRVRMQAGEGAQAAPARPLLQDGNTLIDGETGVLDACGQPKSNMARLVAPPASVA